MTSFIWDLESDSRKAYISEQFKKAFGLNKSDSIEDYKRKIGDLQLLYEIDAGQMTELQLDMIRYFNGERDKTSLTNESYEIAQEIMKISDLKKKEEKYIFRKVTEKEYSILMDKETGEEIKQYGFIKGEKVIVRTEKYMIDGEIHYRYRDSKGRLVSFSKD